MEMGKVIISEAFITCQTTHRAVKIVYFVCPTNYSWYCMWHGRMKTDALSSVKCVCSDWKNYPNRSYSIYIHVGVSCLQPCGNKLCSPDGSGKQYPQNNCDWACLVTTVIVLGFLLAFFFLGVADRGLVPVDFTLVIEDYYCTGSEDILED